MKTAVCSCVVALAISAACLASEPLSKALEQGLIEEEVNRDLNAALRAYESAVAGFDEQRKGAAAALYRLAECYRKLGRTNDAVVQYRRVLAEFADQTALAGLSRTNLARLVPQAAGAAVPRRLTPAAQRQLDLLEQELELVQRQLESERVRVEQGVTPQSALLALQREVLALQRQMAEVETRMGPDLLDVSLPEAEQGTGGADATAGASAALPTIDVAELASLQEELKMVDQELVALQKRLENGKAETSEVRRVQRERLTLERKLPDNAAPERQMGLIQSEIALVDEELVEIQKRIAVGVAPPLAVNPVRRELLSLQRELRAAQRQASAPTPSASDLEASDLPPAEALEIARLREVLKNSPDLLDAPGRPEAPGKGGLTPLESAAGQGQLAVARFLLDHEADVNGLGGDKWTPLLHAASSGHKTMTELLLARGADANGRAGVAFTPLHCAVAGGHRAVLQALLAAKPDLEATAEFHPTTRAQLGVPTDVDPGFTALHTAVKKGSLPLVQALLDAGADVNRPQAHGSAPTPLYLACKEGSPQLVEALLDAKADVNASSGDSGTALGQAVGYHRTDLIELLLERGADVNAAGKSGYAPVHTASLSRSPELLAALLKAKPELNRYTSEGHGPLHLALGVRKAEEANPSMVASLLEAGADVNLPILGERKVAYPLHLAVRGEPTETAIELIELILARKPKIEVLDEESMTPLQRAVLAEEPRLVEPLLAAGADPNAACARDAGNRPLHWAARGGWVAMVEKLLEYRADPNALNASGQTPVSLIVGESGSFSSRLAQRTNPDTAFRLRKVMDLLRAAGADETFHLRDTISVRRPNGPLTVLFRRDGSDVNRFTLFEAIAVLYRPSSDGPRQFLMPQLPTLPLPTQPQPMQPVPVQPLAPPPFGVWSSLAREDWSFPDFARATISRRSERDIQSIAVDLADLLAKGEDQPLFWGDTLEIPEADHPVNATWPGLSEQERQALTRRLSKTVAVSVKGETKRLTLSLAWGPAGAHAQSSGRQLPIFEPSFDAFWLKGAVDASRLVRTSSDLTRVKVSRTDPETGEVKDMMFDLDQGASSDASTAPLWLRDGDRIEIPENALTKAIEDGLGHGCAAGVDVELLKDAALMIVDGMKAEREFDRDFLFDQALDHESQDFGFASRKPVRVGWLVLLGTAPAE